MYRAITRELGPFRHTLLGTYPRLTRTSVRGVMDNMDLRDLLLTEDV